MPELALTLYTLYVSTAFGLRSWLQRRRTGSTGFVGIAGRPGSLEWSGGIAFVLALTLGLAAPILQLADVLEPVALIDGRAGHLAGAVLTGLGIIAALAAQSTMGAAWRVGVREDERTGLVTDGPFAVVRNPFFAATLPVALGLALMVPNVIAMAGFALLILAVEIQVRLVEEPYLLASHGSDYADYARRVGRFAPGLGRLGAEDRHPPGAPG